MGRFVKIAEDIVAASPDMDPVERIANHQARMAKLIPSSEDEAHRASAKLLSALKRKAYAMGYGMRIGRGDRDYGIGEIPEIALNLPATGDASPAGALAKVSAAVKQADDFKDPKIRNAEEPGEVVEALKKIVDNHPLEGGYGDVFYDPESGKAKLSTGDWHEAEDYAELEKDVKAVKGIKELEVDAEIGCPDGWWRICSGKKPKMTHKAPRTGVRVPGTHDEYTPKELEGVFPAMMAERQKQSSDKQAILPLIGAGLMAAGIPTALAGLWAKPITDASGQFLHGAEQYKEYRHPTSGPRNEALLQQAIENQIYGGHEISKARTAFTGHSPRDLYGMYADVSRRLGLTSELAGAEKKKQTRFLDQHFANYEHSPFAALGQTMSERGGPLAERKGLWTQEGDAQLLKGISDKATASANAAHPPAPSEGARPGIVKAPLTGDNSKAVRLNLNAPGAGAPDEWRSARNGKLDELTRNFIRSPEDPSRLTAGTPDYKRSRRLGMMHMLTVGNHAKELQVLKSLLPVGGAMTGLGMLLRVLGRRRGAAPAPATSFLSRNKVPLAAGAAGLAGLGVLAAGGGKKKKEEEEKQASLLSAITDPIVDTVGELKTDVVNAIDKRIASGTRVTSDPSTLPSHFPAMASALPREFLRGYRDSAHKGMETARTSLDKQISDAKLEFERAMADEYLAAKTGEMTPGAMINGLYEKLEKKADGEINQVMGVYGALATLLGEAGFQVGRHYTESRDPSRAKYDAVRELIQRRLRADPAVVVRQAGQDPSHQEPAIVPASEPMAAPITKGAGQKKADDSFPGGLGGMALPTMAAVAGGLGTLLWARGGRRGPAPRTVSPAQPAQPAARPPAPSRPSSATLPISPVAKPTGISPLAEQLRVVGNVPLPPEHFGHEALVPPAPRPFESLRLPPGNVARMRSQGRWPNLNLPLPNVRRLLQAGRLDTGHTGHIDPSALEASVVHPSGPQPVPQMGPHSPSESSAHFDRITTPSPMGLRRAV